jgi:hypothetical protein
MLTKALVNNFFKYFNIKILKYPNLLKLQNRADSLAKYKFKIKF